MCARACARACVCMCVCVRARVCVRVCVTIKRCRPDEWQARQAGDTNDTSNKYQQAQGKEKDNMRKRPVSSVITVPSLKKKKKSNLQKLHMSQYQARNSHRFEGSNEPLRSPSFVFFLVRFTSAPCLVITRRLCSSNKDRRTGRRLSTCAR